MTLVNGNLMNASREWMSRPADQRYTELADLSQAVHTRRDLSKARNVNINELHAELDDAGDVVFNHSVNARPTHWSFGQVAQIAKAPAAYLRTLPSSLVVDCLNTSLAKAERETNKVLTIRNDNDTHDTLQAVTSTTYGRIWDADVVDAVSRIVERTGGRFDNPKDWSGKKSGLYASDHDVFVFMVDGGSTVDAGQDVHGKDDILHRGFMCWNSETGSKTLGLMTFLFRVVCGNHIIWGAQEINKLLIRHSSGAPGRFDAEALPALASYINASASPVEEQIRKAKAMLLPIGVDAIAMQANQWGKFSRGEVRDAITYAEREEGDCRSLWNLVQGLTASARDYQFADTRVDLEMRAGKLLDVVK